MAERIDQFPQKSNVSVEIKDPHGPAVFQIVYEHHDASRSQEYVKDWRGLSGICIEASSRKFYTNEQEAAQFISDLFDDGIYSKIPVISKAFENKKPVFFIDYFRPPSVKDKEMAEFLSRGGVGALLTFTTLLFLPNLNDALVDAARALSKMRIQRRDFLKMLGLFGGSYAAAGTMPQFLQIASAISGPNAIEEGTLTRRMQRLGGLLEELRPYGIPPALITRRTLANLVLALKARAAARRVARGTKNSTQAPDSRLLIPLGGLHMGVEHAIQATDKDLIAAIETLCKRPEITDEIRASVYKLPEVYKENDVIKVHMHDIRAEVNT